MRHEIYYDRSRKRATQTLGTMSLYDFEGEIGKVLVNDCLAIYDQYRKYTQKAHEITERSGYGKKMYLDGTDTKMVKFDTIRLSVEEDYEGNKQLCFKGERDMDADEIAAMEEETKAYQEREKEQLRKLKEKYPDV